MNTKFKYKNIAEAAIALIVIAIIMAIPGIPAPMQVTSTYVENMTQSEPYTVTETQQETVHHTLSLLDKGKGDSSFTGYALQSYLQVCFSLYPAESINDISSKTSPFIVETGGNLQKQKIRVWHDFDSTSPFGVAGDGSICIPKTGGNMQNCQLIATWNMNQSYDWQSQSYSYSNCPFGCFHNSPLLIPISRDSNPATVTIYSPQDWQDSGCKGHLHLDLSKIDASKVWFSMRLSPDADQYDFNVSDLRLDYSWDEIRSVDKITTKYRESQVEVPKQNITTDYKKNSLWQWLLGK